MYYELYIDILFLVNFIMDFILLLLAKKLLHCNTSYYHLAGASVIGASGVCVIILLRIPGGVTRTLLQHLLLNGLMIRVGLGVKSWNSFIKSYVCLYLGGFLLGGVYQWFSRAINISLGIRNFFFISVGSYIILTIGMHIYSHFKIESKRFYNITLYLGERKVQVKGLKDTGNSLRDPISRKPVSIVEFEALEQCLTEEEKTSLLHMFRYETEGTEDGCLHLHYIPFRSIGKQNGMLPGMSFEKMCVQGEQQYWVEHPVLAICREPLAKNRNYQMILHPEMVEESYVA